MSGIDHQDQLLSYYPCERRTIRWYKKLFIHTIRLLMLNALKLYNAYSRDNKMPLYNFRFFIINGLLPPASRHSISKHSIVRITETYEDKSSYNRVKRKKILYIYLFYLFIHKGVANGNALFTSATIVKKNIGCVHSAFINFHLLMLSFDTYVPILHLNIILY